MSRVIDQTMKEIDRREWHLWILAFTMILVLGGITAATYFFIVEETFQPFNEIRSTANKALGGLCILIALFCAYVIHTRTTFGRVRHAIEDQAVRDQLTDLYNRRYFTYRLEEEIVRARQDGTFLAILLCDLDDFQAINNAWGQQVGDDVLKAAAASIQESTRKTDMVARWGSDLVARWGGDEMVVALTHTTREGVLIAAERIRRGVHRISETVHFDLDLSIGIALYPEHGSDVNDLLRLAGRALHIAKKGGDKIHVGEEEYSLEEDAIKSVFQPVVDIRSGSVLAYEALCRDPQEKLSTPELFQRYKAIGRLHELKRLCFRTQLKEAWEAGLPRLFINVDFEMLTRMEPTPKPDGIDVVLEISERDALYEVDSHLKTAGVWRALGFKFAIDDFGAGFISLPFLARLVPEYIKIDQSTILQAVSSDQFREFLAGLIQAMRHYSGEGIIAEGVETAEELQVVRELGINLVQGFYLGRPEPLKKFLPLPPDRPSCSADPGQARQEDILSL